MLTVEGHSTIHAQQSTIDLPHGYSPTADHDDALLRHYFWLADLRRSGAGSEVQLETHRTGDDGAHAGAGDAAGADHNHDSQRNDRTNVAAIGPAGLRHRAVDVDRRPARHLPRHAAE